MKINKLLLLGLFLAVVATVKGDDLYVYGTNGSKQAFDLNEVRSLALSADALVINFKSGNPVSVVYSDLNFFSLIDYTFTSIRTLGEADVLKVFPNPVADEFTITNREKITSIKVLDLQGRQLLQITPGGQEVKVSMASYPAGIYLVQISDENGTTVKKIIKN
jgi:hypothetical protein